VAPEPTQTAVIVPVVAAEPVVDDHRRRLDVAASWGVPAHVTVLFPFVPPVDVDDHVIGRLREVCATVPAFDCTFAECGWFGDGVLWLAPDPGEQFRDLTRRVSDEFPGFAPYGGAFDDVVPHLTVGESTSTDELRAAELAVAGSLPFTARIEHALLIAGTDQPGSWRTVAELPLGTSTVRLHGV
jgi:2'-5' RNA ligase